MDRSRKVRSYGSFAAFNDPDGNGCVFQESTTRLPGRVSESDTTFNSSSELAGALRRAAAAHGEHEKALATTTKIGRERGRRRILFVKLVRETKATPELK